MDKIKVLFQTIKQIMYFVLVLLFMVIHGFMVIQK